MTSRQPLSSALLVQGLRDLLQRCRATAEVGEHDDRRALAAAAGLEKRDRDRRERGVAMTSALFKAAALATTLATATGASAQVSVITADRLLDVRSGRYVSDPQIVVREGRIASMGRRGDAVPEGAERIDLRGKTLLPGLIDMHVHLDSDPNYGGYTRLQFSDRFWSAVMVPHAERTLMAGFTTVRNVGARTWNDVGLREAIDAGKVLGPRVVTAAQSFGSTGGHCDSTFFPPSMDQKNAFNADSVDEARKSVRTVRKYGAQVIKICATGGVFSRNTEPGQQQMTVEVMKAVVDEAAMWGLRVAAHAHGTAGI